MNSAVLWVAIGSLASTIGIVISFLAFRESRSDASTKRKTEQIRQVVRGEIDALIIRQQELVHRLDDVASKQNDLAQTYREQNAKIGAMLDRLTALETKMEVFWRSVAMDAAKIIHSPDPRRAHVDALLEAFMDDTITPIQEDELRGILENIRDWEPAHQTTGFPVYPGEQIAAAILLRTMHATSSGGGK